MVQCPRCGAQCGEQDAKDGRCFRCATFIQGVDAGYSAKTIAAGQAASPPTDGPHGPSDILAVSDSEPGKKDLIRPRALSPEYERHIAAEWHGTILGRLDETIKKGASPAEDSYDLNIGTRRVSENPDDDLADYVLLDVIGKGGMGEVWSARQASLDRTIAIKIPHDDVSRSSASGSGKGSEARNQFVSEVVVTGQLDHPNIIPIHDIAHTQNGQLFYSMKKVEGRPWNECLREKSREDNLEILMKVCDAIRYAHDKHGVIHRDIKPENIVVGDFAEVSVMDFGLALEIDKLSLADGGMQSSIAGTPAYMAPEMATGSAAELGFHTDVYLLGAVLYEIITGRSPHPSPEPTEDKSKRKHNMLLIITRNEIVPIEEKGELVDIAYQALATDINDRYQSVREFQDAIRAYWEHQKSVTLTKRGFEHLVTAMRNGRSTGEFADRFHDFDRARFAFDEAIQLWSGNSEAKKGAEKTCLAYAKYALEQQAYAQGIALLDEDNSTHTSLLGKLRKAKRQQENAQKTAERVKYYTVAGVITVLTVIAMVSGIAALLINEEKKKAVVSEQKAVVSEQKAIKSEEDAVGQKENAEKNAVAAQNAKSEATIAQYNTWYNAFRAKFQKDIAERAKQTAELSAYEAEIGLAAEEAKRNAFDNLRDSLSRINVLLISDKDTIEHGVGNGRASKANELLENFKGNLKKERGAIEDEKNLLLEEQDLHTNMKEAIEDNAKKQGTRLAELESDANYYVNNPNNSTSTTSEPSVPQQQTTDKTKKHDPRGWEWGHLKYLSSLGSQDLLSDDNGKYESVALTPDETWAAACTSDGRFALWKRPEPNKSFARFAGSDPRQSGKNPVYAVALSQTEGLRYLFAAATDEGIMLWDVTELDAGLPAADAIQNSKRSSRPLSVAFSPDGRHLAASWEDGHVGVWIINSGKPRPLWPSKKFDTPTKKLADAAIWSVRFSSNGSRLVTACENGYVEVWDKGTGKKIERFSGTEPVYCADFLPGGSHVVAGDRNGRIMAWTLPNTATSANFESRQLARARQEQVMPKGVEIGQHEEAVRALSVVATDGNNARIFSVGHDNTVRVWDVSQNLNASQLAETLRGHGGWVRSCAASPDGDHVLSGGYDGRVRLWDLPSYEFPQILKQMNNSEVSQERITSVAYTANGDWIATTADDGALVVWDMRAPGGPAPTYPDEGHDMLATTARPFGDGRFLLTSAGDNTTRIWEIASGRELLRIGSHWQRADGTGTGYRGVAAASDDGRLIATGSDPLASDVAETIAKVWDASTGQQVATMLNPKDALKNNENPEATALAFSPDGGVLLVGDQFGACRLFAIPSGRLLSTFTHRGKVTTAKFLAHDGKLSLYASSSDGTVVKWNIHGNAAQREIELMHGKRRVTAMDVSEDGRSIVSSSVSEDHQARLHLWDLSQEQGPRRTNARLTYEIDGQNIVSHLEFHRDDKSVVLVTAFEPDTSDYSVNEWNFSVGESGTYRPQLNRQSREIAMAAYLPDQGRNSFVTVGGRTARQLSKLVANRSRKMMTDMTFRRQSGLTSASFSPDGKTLACASADGTIKFWRLEESKRKWKSDPAPKLLDVHQGDVRSVAFHPESNDLLLTAGGDGTALVWRRSEQAWDFLFPLTGHDKAVNHAAFSVDGDKIITASDDETVRIWSVDFEAKQANLQRTLTHVGPVATVAMSPDKEYVVSTTGTEALIWQSAGPPTANQEDDAKVLSGHAAQVTAAIFCGSTGRVATTSKDLTVRIWNTSGIWADDDKAKTAKPLLTLEEHTGQVTSVAFIPENIGYIKKEDKKEGAYLITAGLDGQTILWPSVPIPSAETAAQE